MSVRHNKGLEQTGSAATNGMGRPCSSIQCSAYLEVRTHLNGQAIAVGARTGQMEPKESSSGKDPDPNQGKVL